MKTMLVEFDSGLPALIRRPAKLEDMARRYGKPTAISTTASRVYVSWMLYPDLRVEQTSFAYPWPDESPKRQVVKIHLGE
jgi:hypothetical protein